MQDPRRCWAPTGLRPNVHYQVIREFVYALAAVHPPTGSLISLVMPWVDTTTMSIFLAHLAHAFPDELLVVLLDGAGWHHARELTIPPTVALLFLPPYSPQLNPAEHIWDHLRENDFANKTFEDLVFVEDTLCSGLHSLTNHPETVRSLTYFDWLKTLPLM